MTGIESLLQLAEPIKKGIKEKYKTLGAFYNVIIELEEKEYSLLTTKTEGFKDELKIIQNSKYDIADELEKFGAEDGMDIISDVISDFTGKVASKFTQIVLTEAEKYGDEFKALADSLRQKLQNLNSGNKN